MSRPPGIPGFGAETRGLQRATLGYSGSLPNLAADDRCAEKCVGDAFLKLGEGKFALAQFST
ncbi:hypothetical protein SODALDRAFT_360285 [Sodiomyces alkalinus F11]|uniref:Uncharacterized protein n=1 Tax=Sodiomyces alkalinus (strain CBS 110278 / VKM F-3762 / F11) TaxID=1314773 RepID=A0A3N2PUG7_SODAK|nr:hypothetical protein SODALDRAFT_360285 [Sodiomyces alkalinus F11]ROT37966.1 hypothetical protein SODALDRAFT_360285 [Sodiomyces alkalinus F11]